jgi:hypothetical protein
MYTYENGEQIKYLKPLEILTQNDYDKFCEERLGKYINNSVYDYIPSRNTSQNIA